MNVQMIEVVLERKNKQIKKNNEMTHADEFSFCYSGIDEEEICLFRRLFIGRLYHQTRDGSNDHTNKPSNKLWICHIIKQI